jgi:hypothetical protein
MTNEHDTPENTQEPPAKTVTDDDLFNLMSQLEGLLTNGPARAQGTLLRQSETLDALFSTLVARHLKDAVTGHFYGTAKPADTAAWLGMILQVQKQCSEAIRVASAVNYMDTMASVQLTPSAIMARRPLPRVDS